MSAKTHQPSRATPTPHCPSSRDIGWFRTRLLVWFGANARSFPWRRKSATRYEQIVSEVLLQRTRAETVAAFFPRFLHRYPSWRHLARARTSRIAGDLHQIGLWRRRSESLKRLAEEMTRRRGRFPTVRGELEALPGVGQYIANAVSLFHHAEPRPLLDSSMARVLERFFGPRKLADIRYDPYLQKVAHGLVATRDARKINWATLDLAARICTLMNPRCADCPLAGKCKARVTFSRAARTEPRLGRPSAKD